MYERVPGFISLSGGFRCLSLLKDHLSYALEKKYQLGNLHLTVTIHSWSQWVTFSQMGARVSIFRVANQQRKVRKMELDLRELSQLV